MLNAKNIAIAITVLLSPFIVVTLGYLIKTYANMLGGNTTLTDAITFGAITWIVTLFILSLLVAEEPSQNKEWS